MFWANVDKPTRTCVIHKDECWCILRKESPYKGIEKFKPNGGWFQFPSIRGVENYAKEWEAKGYKVWKCKHCFT